jgi:squalene-hopene/tetraprenyl-beta-curcumene cyclase
MRRALTLSFCILTAALLLCHQVPSRASNTSSTSWNPQSAANYLDQRAAWWMSWPKAQRDHETFCISCHTAVPYAMSRAALRPALAESTPSANELRLLENVTKRVRIWKEAVPFYLDADRGPYKSVESRGTESVLNALVLASRDAQTGHLTDDTRTAFANMWAEQQTAQTSSQASPASDSPAYSESSSSAHSANTTVSPAPDQRGAWRWLRFKNEPWEADDSDFYGAALAAIATGTTPENYRARPEIQSNLKLLREYLNRQAPSQTQMNRVVLLWASTKLPGLLTSAQQESMVREIIAKQKDDGGWSLPALAGGWKRHDDTAQDPQSDGYATGLIAFTLEQLQSANGAPRTKAQGAASLQSALAWLRTNQDLSTGSWPSASLNNNEAHHIGPETVRFMNDAATSYAILALTNSPSR